VKVVVGLGNPGDQYENTPHSIGFEVVDALAGRLGCGLRRSLRFRVRSGRAVADGTDVLLVKPQTFMNASGPAVAAVLRYNRVEPADMIVVLDDADLQEGRIRVRPGGGSGGHKGLQSVIDSVGTEAFARVRLGVGREQGADLVRHVLGVFPPDKRALMNRVVKEAADAVMCTLDAGADRAMNEYNAKQIG